MHVLLFLAAGFLAYANGANDNFKGVASLFGSRSATYRTAIWWATLTTAMGSIGSIFVAQSLLTRFSGRGLVPDQIAGSEALLVAVALGAGITVMSATLVGLPISTTHALTGALAGGGLAAARADVNLHALGTGFLLPLALAPVLAIAAAASLYMALHYMRLRSGVTKEWCICVGQTQQVVSIPQPTSAMALQHPVALPLAVSTGDSAQCAERYAGAFLGVGSQAVIDCVHFLSAGVVSFARGLNDTPKVAALLLAGQALDVRSGAFVIAIAMAIGGLLNARRVAETMSHRITSMNHGQGLAANLSTGLLVILASMQGLPVSTTHVSVGSLFGIGLTSRSVNRRVALAVLASWVLTLPCAALAGGLIYWIVIQG